MKTSFSTGLSGLGKSSSVDPLSTKKVGKKFVIDNAIIPFGKFTGTLWTRCEIEYLKWLFRSQIERPVEIRNVQYKACDVAEFELRRREVNLDDTLYVTAHAVDRATGRYLLYYQSWREFHPGGGVYKWLTEMASKALALLEFGEDRIEFHNMVFVFEQTANCDILKTVI